MDRNEIKKMRYEDKKTMLEIANKLKCSREVIRKYLKSIGDGKGRGERCTDRRMRGDGLGDPGQ